MEGSALVCLKACAAFGASVVVAQPRSEKYLSELALVYKDRLLVAPKAPSPKKLVYLILESYQKNPLKDSPLSSPITPKRSVVHKHHADDDGQQT
ncbi:hypothetical protein HDV03_001319, partial [Kappamyces sp. JEL0829]